MKLACAILTSILLGNRIWAFSKFLMSRCLLALRKEQLSPEDNWLNGFRSCFGRLIDQFLDFVPVTLRLWPPLILRDQEPC